MEDLLLKMLYLSLDLSLLTLFPPNNLPPLGNTLEGSSKGEAIISRNPQLRTDHSEFSDEPYSVSPYFGVSGPGVTTGVDFLSNLVNTNIDACVNITNYIWQGMQENVHAHNQKHYYTSYSKSGEDDNRISTKGEVWAIQHKSAVNVNKYLSSPELRETMDMFYGMFRGEPGCIKRVVCVFGANLNEMPAGRFVLQTWLHMMPLDWKELKRILRKSFMEQENCSLYKCGFTFSHSVPSTGDLPLPKKRTMD